MANGNGWKHLLWTGAGAVGFALLGVGLTGWQKFTILQERQEYLMRLNEQQNLMFESVKDSIRSLQQQSTLQGETDKAQREKLIEHDEYLKHILGRLREIEKQAH